MKFKFLKLACLLMALPLSSCKSQEFGSEQVPDLEPQQYTNDLSGNIDIAGTNTTNEQIQTTNIGAVTKVGTGIKTGSIGGSNYKPTETKPTTTPPSDNNIGGATRTYRFTTLGQPFRNGQLRDNLGKISCNFDTARNCNYDYPAGTRITLTMPTSLFSISHNHTLFYGGYWQCNGARINAANPTITIVMDRDQECGAWYQATW